MWVGQNFKAGFLMLPLFVKKYSNQVFISGYLQIIDKHGPRGVKRNSSSKFYLKLLILK